MRNIVSTCLVLLLVTALGCGQDGPVKYTVNGTIEMPDGKPVPAGEISFEPDAAAGNQGPGSMAQIKDGKFSLAREQGVVGGAYLVTISPFDGVAHGESLQGKPLRNVPYGDKVTLPKEDTVQNFKIK